MAETTYIILKKIPTTEDKAQPAWQPIGTFIAGSGEQAAKKFMNQSGNGEKFGEGSYRGVSERAWGEEVPIQKKISFG